MYMYAQYFPNAHEKMTKSLSQMEYHMYYTQNHSSTTDKVIAGHYILKVT